VRWFAGATLGLLLVASVFTMMGHAGAVSRGGQVEARILVDPSAAPPPAMYPVNGTITDSLTGDPIAGAMVRASSGPTTTSGANGSYAVVVQSGPETFTYTHRGYHTRSVNFPVGAPRVEDVALNPFAWILSGSILDLATSTPIIGAAVTADAGGFRTTTGALGQYSLTLENGTYVVNASAPGFTNGTAMVTMNGSPLSKFILLPPAGAHGASGTDPNALLAIGIGIAAGIVGLGYLVLASWGYRVRRKRLGPIAAIPAERDPDLPPQSRSSDRNRHSRRRN
jgi:Carboxypeptidase regulatory-like domain